MNYAIYPPHRFNPDFTPHLPLSKSISNRSLILDALSGEMPKKNGIAECDDTAAIMRALSDTHQHHIDIGAAGTAMRFLTAYLSTIDNRTFTIDGSERMRHRPIRELVDALQCCGAKIEYLREYEFPPLAIHGRRLKGGELSIDPSVSSQFISALLMIAPIMTDGLTITLDGDIVSAPYIYMTIEMMRRRGVDVNIDNREGHMIIHVDHSEYKSDNTPIEPDWSAASYWYEYSVLTGVPINIPTPPADSLQGDSAVYNMFQTAICNSCQPVVMDFLTCPDLAQTFVVTLALLGIPFRFTGLNTLKIKETDRIQALCLEMKKLGIPLKTPADGTIEWTGNTTVPEINPIIDTYKDHRMAMSMAFAALKFPGIIIRDTDVVSKSYPGFWKDMSRAGFTLNPI